MILEQLNEVSILVSALLAMAVGSIWYSPLLFGKLWMEASGLTASDLERSREKMPKLFALGFIVNIVLIYILAIFVSLAKEAVISLSFLGTLLVVFLGAVMASAVIWEKRPVSYLVINVGYAAVVVFGGMTVLWYWPW